MKSFISLSAVIAVMMGVTATMASSPAGQLSAPLELKVSQAGFAGITGTVTTIEPDGGYRVSTFVNEMVRPPESEGRLPPEALQAIVRSLEAQDFSRLPDEMGEPPPVNAKTVTLRYGDRSAAMVLEPGADLPAAAAASGPESRFAAIVQSVTRAVDAP
ncbi:MAG TPA: hypothetical protein VK943_05005 [Arenibaculum sp.]|nr:hypothetical protein [Arenibaculum sp.]